MNNDSNVLSFKPAEPQKTQIPSTIRINEGVGPRLYEAMFDIADKQGPKGAANTPEEAVMGLLEWATEFAMDWAMSYSDVILATDAQGCSDDIIKRVKLLQALVRANMPLGTIGVKEMPDGKFNAMIGFEPFPEGVYPVGSGKSAAQAVIHLMGVLLTSDHTWLMDNAKGIRFMDMRNQPMDAQTQHRALLYLLDGMSKNP